MNAMKRFLAIVLALATVFTVTATALAYNETTVSGTRYITSSNGGPVNVRTGPGTNYSLAPVGQFAVGTQVSLLSMATGTDGNTWYKVQNSNQDSGWVRGDFLTTDGSSAGGETTYVATLYVDVPSGETVNVRSAPSTSSTIRATLGRGSVVTTKAITADGEWVKLSTPIENGYVMLSFLSEDYIGAVGANDQPYDVESAFGSRTLVRGNAGTAVYNLQIALWDLGYLDDYDECDSIFGSKTEQAVKNFQLWCNLEDDGMVGPATKEELWNRARWALTSYGIAIEY